MKKKSNFHKQVQDPNFLVSPKHTFNEILEKNRSKSTEKEKVDENSEFILEKFKLPSVSNYVTKFNKDCDLARSDGFKGFKIIFKPERRSFEELNLEDGVKKQISVVNQEMHDLMRFKEEIG